MDRGELLRKQLLGFWNLLGWALGLVIQSLSSLLRPARFCVGLDDTSKVNHINQGLVMRCEAPFIPIPSSCCSVVATTACPPVPLAVTPEHAHPVVRGKFPIWAQHYDEVQSLNLLQELCSRATSDVAFKRLQIL